MFDPAELDPMDPPTDLTEAPGCEAPLERVEAMLTEGAGHMAAAMCQWLLSLASFDRRMGWASWGCRSAAHWLTFRCGVDLHSAREQVKVAGRLPDLPRIREAFGRGEFSFWQVRLLVRVATPETEESLLDLARAATTAQLSSIVGGLRRVLAIEDDRHRKRNVRWFFDEDGFLVLSGRLAPEEGAVVAKALEAIVDDLLRAKRQRIREARAHVPDAPEDPPGEVDDPSGASRADALVAMARLALAESTQEVRDRAQVVVHVERALLEHEGEARTEASEADAEASEADAEGSEARTEGSEARTDGSEADAEGRCELEGGPSIPRGTALRLACDAALVTLVEDAEGNPLSVGRRTRTIPPALRRALRSRDGGCRFPGCPETRFVEGHHVTHWAHGGETSLQNLLELCTFHHRLHHEGGYTVEGTPPHLRFLRPDGTVIEAVRPPGPYDDDLAQSNEQQGLAIDPDTIVSRWCGERLNLGYVVSCVVGSEGWRAASAARAPARAGPHDSAGPP